LAARTAATHCSRTRARVQSQANVLVDRVLDSLKPIDVITDRISDHDYLFVRQLPLQDLLRDDLQVSHGYLVDGFSRFSFHNKIMIIDKKQIGDANGWN
jgi:phosphatidylserine/phosphatidylglycerophosphate/cardiolipin synthase-like enzyme